ncbi:hypothetical protein HBI27_061970 [Parastagonospora nodorum]|nr:hypothetical protein HBI27_061970 [Parastagonospora nodorum]
MDFPTSEVAKHRFLCMVFCKSWKPWKHRIYPFVRESYRSLMFGFRDNLNTSLERVVARQAGQGVCI